MAPSKLRKAIGAVKDQTSIGLAKVGSSTSLSELDVAIVKATRHEEYPPDERYIREILSLTCYSRAHVGSCVSTIARRLSKTRNWVVALKTLMLIQRLLWEGDTAYEQEIFFATRRGTRLLNMSDFRDTSGRSNAWDYSAFVRTYALYLDEKLEFKMQGRRGKRSAFGYNEEEEVERGGGDSHSLVVRATPVREMKNDRIFSRVHHLMQLLERFLACKPTGAAKHHRVVTVAFYPIVKESFQLYYDITEILSIFIDRFAQLDIADSVKVYEIFCRVSKQYEELDTLYAWCKSVGIARSSEYPDVEKIPKKRLDLIDDFIHEKTKANNRIRARSAEPKPDPVESEPEEELETIKALPAPEQTDHNDSNGKVDPKEESTLTEEKNKAEETCDFLKLGEDLPSSQQHGDQLALALFDCNQSATDHQSNAITPWEAFKDTSGDWETSLVQSASHLSNQKASLPGGFDTLLLDGMYQKGAAVYSGPVATGSSSSVALGSAGRPAMLALPAPPAADGGVATFPINSDPFAASLAVAPPAYVQISELEKKQRFLTEEQVMWQQYARDGMHGQVGYAKVQPQQQQQQMNPNYQMYNNGVGGGYTRTY